MNSIFFYEYGKPRIEIVVIGDNNLFIGGVASVINTPAILRNYLQGESVTLTDANFNNFTIIGDDIQCNIDVDYKIAYAFNTLVTYFIDTENKCKTLGYNAFYICGKLKKVLLKGVVLATERSFNGSYRLQRIELDNLSGLTAYYAFIGNLIGGLVYFPNLLTFGTPSVQDNVFITSYYCKIYLNLNMSTCNDGTPDLDVVDALTRNNEIVYIQNTTKPSAITNLSINTVYSTAIRLQWNVPSSLNTIDFYDVFIDDEFYTTTKTPNVFIQGLNNLQTYKFTVIPIDIYYNKGAISNAITQQITGTALAQFSDLASIQSHYKFNYDMINSISGVKGTSLGTSFVEGFIGQAFHPRGLKDINTNQNFFGGRNNISIFVRFKRVGEGTVFANYYSPNFSLMVRILGTSLQWYTYTGTQKGGTVFDVSDTVDFHDFVFTYDGTIMKAYRDGIVSPTTFAQSGNTLISSNSDSIAQGYGAVCNGIYDEFAILNRAVTQAEVTEMKALRDAGLFLKQ